jgi:tetratricopeptide (TPR) repeat protein
LERGKKEDALKYLKYVVTLYPDSVEPIINLGVYYQENGDLDKARDYYNKAKNLHSNNAALWHNSGRIYYMENNLTEAVSDYIESLRLRPGDIDTLLDKGIAHIKLSELEEADKCFDEILIIDPDNKSALYLKSAIAYTREMEGEADDVSRA